MPQVITYQNSYDTQIEIDLCVRHNTSEAAGISLGAIQYGLHRGVCAVCTSEQAMCIVVAGIVGDDGTGTLGVIVRQALRENRRASPYKIAEIVREARADAAVEAERGKAP